VAEVVRYVNTASSGGDGTTNAESGANAAYASLSAWEAAEQTNLVSDGDWHHVYVSTGSGTAADTSTVNISGWTTGASNYILIEAADGDQAVKTSYDTNRYRLECTSSCLTISEDYVRVDGVQIKLTISAGDAAAIIAGGGQITQTNSDIRVSNCRVLGDISGTAGGRGIWWNENINGYGNVSVWNTIVTGFTGGSGTCAGVQTGFVETFDVYNSIVRGCASGFYENNSGFPFDNIINVASFVNTDDFNSVTGTIDYCASDDGDGTNSVSPSGGDWDNEYTDSANGDFTLVASGNCEGGGTDDPGSGLYSTDMDGDSYSSPWSIGVDAKSGGGSSLSAVLNDSYAFDDDASPIWIAYEGLNDSYDFADAAVVGQQFRESLGDSYDFADAVSAILGLSASLSDSYEFSDSVSESQQFTVTLGDSYDFADSVETITKFVESVADSYDFDDSILVVQSGGIVGYAWASISAKTQSVTIHMKEARADTTAKVATIERRTN
jgi:hypothetical protein